MSARSGPAAGLFRLFRFKPADAYNAYDAVRSRELAENMALLHARRRKERSARWLHRMALLWPLAAGLLLGAMAPALEALAESLGPWGMILIFPFAMLARRPEIHAGPIGHLLPAFMLYAQFPIEGLLARVILRRRIRPLSVAGQVMLFHFLGVLELWMLSGGDMRLLGR